MHDVHGSYMRRCLELAAKGLGHVAPNPLVGAVLVHGSRIIGEGWHQKFGGRHAEVNCLQSVIEADRHLIPDAVLYVSLEPCAHHGKTPPCTELIIRAGIRKVVIGCEDPFPEVHGKGIDRLRQAGTEVIVSVLRDECRDMNRRFLTFHEKHRPYIILKWAQTADGFIGSGTKKRLMISNESSNRLVHRWRSEEAAILAGTNTVELDDPLLTSRWGKGAQPARLVLDKKLRLPKSLRIFHHAGGKVYILNDSTERENSTFSHVRLSAGTSLVQAILEACCRLQLQSVLVEGGRQLLQSFIEEGSWDEARVIRSEDVRAYEGVSAPVLPTGKPSLVRKLANDELFIYRNQY